jgi:hypothetical protein
MMAILSEAPDFHDRHAWLATACEVRTRLLGDWMAEAPCAGSNLGLPTWLFGHQPPNFFATHIGKVFYNSLREDGLVTVADGGIIFAEGDAGTVQEVFQDAAQNYYRPAGTAPTPMVLYNSTRGFWVCRAGTWSIAIEENRCCHSFASCPKSARPTPSTIPC